MEQSSRKTYQEAPCLICGQTRFTYGVVTGQAILAFIPADSSLAGKLFGGSHEKVKARRCDECGNVQFFV